MWFEIMKANQKEVEVLSSLLNQQLTTFMKHAV